MREVDEFVKIIYEVAKDTILKGGDAPPTLFLIDPVTKKLEVKNASVYMQSPEHKDQLREVISNARIAGLEVILLAEAWAGNTDSDLAP
jgi:hypothetical protein